MNQDLHPKKCYTIGYGDLPIDTFVYILNKVGIDLIVDVRSYPYSRFNPCFNRDNLENSLMRNDIYYTYSGDQIGGRYSNPNLLYPDGTVNYQKVRNTELFQDGINQLLTIISSGRRIALLCAEKEPERCHRFLLISRDLQSRGIKVIHVLPETRLLDNEDLEKELIGAMVDTKQTSISEEPVNPVDLMYEKLNRKIAYKVKSYHTPSDEGAPVATVIGIPKEQGRDTPVEDPGMNCVREPDYGDEGLPLPLSSGTDLSNMKKHVQQKLIF